MQEKLFTPNNELISKSNIFNAMTDLGFEKYDDFYKWSIEKKVDFIDYSVKKIGVKFDQSYDLVFWSEGTWFEGAKMNIVESCFSQDSTKAALVFKAENGEIVSLNFAELKSLVLRVVAGLRQKGFRKGRRCVIYMPMNVTSIVLYLALVAAGMVVVLVPDSFSESELQKRIEIVGAEVIFASDEYVYNQKKINLESKLENLNEVEVYLAKGKDCILKDFGFKQLLSDESADFEYMIPSDYISILFSSGTTKDPKAIPWKHWTPIKCAIDGYYHQDIHSSDVVSWTTGMGWMMAPWLIFATLINGATLAIYQGAYHSEDYGKFVEQSKISVLGVIPSLVKAWKNSGLMEQFNWEVRVFTSTGEPSNSEDYLYLQSLSLLDAPIIEYCGGTEIGGGYITNTVVEPSLVSAFSTATLGTELEFVSEGELKEVLIAIPALGLSDELLNYDHDQEYFDERLDMIRGKKLRRHGDAYEMVNIAGKNFYKSRGRVDDTFNLNGIKVSAVEIEQVVSKFEGVVDVAAVSVADDGPESLVIFYCSETEYDEQFLLSEFQKLISQNLNPLYRLSRVVRIDEMPRTASNKLMRKELRKLLG